MQVSSVPGLSINIPEFFARPDFQQWLNKSGAQRATWHVSDTVPNEYSDVFLTFDNGEGSDFDELFPADLLALICRCCVTHGLRYGIVRLTNLAE